MTPVQGQESELPLASISIDDLVHSPDSLSSDEEVKFDKNSRHELKREAHWILILLLKCMGLAAIAICLIRAYHLAAPDGWCWLDDAKIQSIDKILFSGAVGGFIGRYINQIIPK